ncbi:MAG: CoA transferase [Proteobacteria bacterium]|nr:MAG: CoA transferase [Pseudomonadota bacterium]TDJ63738.1 MAG: CoA transferase [Pseudomonadota bacterium]
MSDDKPMPLAGVRVIDVATMLAAPFCASILGEFGAEVIKVEMPGKGDPLRHFGTMTETGSTLNWLNENRNKKSITLDLRKDAGATILRRLVSDCDILVENFRPGTMERWGLGFDALKSLNDDLIMVRISAYGQDGPYRNRPGFARIAHGFSGLALLAGDPDGPPVVPGSTSLGDYISGLYGALGALLAYTSRERYGVGQTIDIGLYEGVFRMLDELAPAYARSGTVRQRMGADTVNAVPHSHYKTNDGAWVALACSTDKMFERLAKVMDRVDLVAADQYATIGQREAGRDEINQIVAAWIGSLSRDEVIQRCLDGEVPIGPLNDIADIFSDPQFAARENLLKVEDPRAGEVVIPNVVPRLSETPGRFRSLGPDLGEHNREIYTDELGFSAEELRRLADDGVI